MSREEKKNNRIAALLTFVINGGVLALLLLVAAWRAPNPPNPEYGIELNFGLDTQGFGEKQPEETVGTPEQNNTEQQTEIKEETKPQPEEKTEEIVNPVVTKTESPVVVKETKTEIKEVTKPSTEVKKETTPVKEEVKKVDDKAVYKPTNKNTESKDGKAGNNGDDPGKVGDKGNPEGTLNPNASYTGNPGGGDGGVASLDLAGWNWDTKPVPKWGDDKITGQIVFLIKVDENGEITSITKEKSSVSLAAEKACRAEIEKLTFTKTGTNVPKISEGRITFTIRAQ
jgi:protein TonB